MLMTCSPSEPEKVPPRKKRRRIVQHEKLVSHKQEVSPISPLGQTLRSARYILVLAGAGLSASSGISTFRGAESYWGDCSPSKLASQSAFNNDPVLVWQFHEKRRQVALNAKPNAGHVALSRLANAKPDLLMITQNVDGALDVLTMIRQS